MTPVPDRARAMVLYASRDIRAVDIDIPETGETDGLLRVEASGVCGSDLALYRGEKPEVGFPLIPGHEIVAEVLALGPVAAHRRGLKPGDRVVLEEALPCGLCERCLNGRHRTCGRAQRYGGTRLDDGGELLGGYASHVRLPPRAVAHRVPNGLSADLATLFIPLSNGFSWVGATGQLRAGDTVVVMGPGQHGLACVLAARHLGAGTVVVVGRERDQPRFDAAVRLGADVTMNVDDEDPVSAVMDLTAGRGADIVVDATPRATRPVVDAIQMAAVGGRVVLAGAKRGATVDGFPSDLLYKREITVAGVHARESWAIPVALEFMSADPTRVAPMTGPVYPLEDLEQAIQILMSEGAEPAPVHVSVAP